MRRALGALVLAGSLWAAPPATAQLSVSGIFGDNQFAYVGEVSPSLTQWVAKYPTGVFSDITVEAVPGLGFDAVDSFIGIVHPEDTNVYLRGRVIGTPGTVASFKARVKGTLDGQPVQADSSDAITITVQEAVNQRLRVNGQTPAEHATARHGDELTYSLSMANLAETPAQLTEVGLPTPAGTTLKEESAVPAEVGGLARVEATKTVVVDDDLPDGTAITTSVAPKYAMSEIGLEPRPAVPVFGTTDTVIVQAADVKPAGNTFVDLNGGRLESGDPVRGTARIRNAGHAPATALTLRLAATGVAMSSFSVDGAACDATCTTGADAFEAPLPALAPGATAALTYEGTVTAAGGDLGQTLTATFSGDVPADSPLTDSATRTLFVPPAVEPEPTASPTPTATASPPPTGSPSPTPTPIGPPPPPPSPPAFGELARLPAAKQRCVRRLSVRLLAPAGVRRAVVRFGSGRRTRDAGPRYTDAFVLKRLPARRFRLKIAVTLEDGTIVRGGRRYRGCKR